MCHSLPEGKGTGKEADRRQQWKRREQTEDMCSLTSTAPWQSERQARSTSRTARWRQSRGFGRPAISQRSQPAGPRHGKGLPQAPWLCKHGKRWRLRDHSGWYASGAAFASLQALSRGSSGVRRKNIPCAVQIDDSGTRLAPDDRLYEMPHVGPLHFIYAEDEHPGRADLDQHVFRHNGGPERRL